MARNILGVDLNDRGTSAALIVDGQIVAAVQQERLNREKYTRRFPSEAIDFCLGRAQLTLKDIDVVAVSVDPAIYLEAFAPQQTERARYRGELLMAPINLLLGRSGAKSTGQTVVTVETQELGKTEFRYVRHHDAHAAIAHYTSGFQKSAILVVDAFGEKDSTVGYLADGINLQRVHEVEFPHSLGSFYAAMTQFLGMRPFRDEWKLMAAAAKGNPANYLEELGQTVRMLDGGRFELDLRYFSHHVFHRPNEIAPALLRLLGPSYSSPTHADQRFFDLAAATQVITEEILVALAIDLRRRTNADALCISGGVAHNCVAASHIVRKAGFKQLYIPPAPDDSGTSLGAALYVSHCIDGQPQRPAPVHHAWGPTCDDDSAAAEFERNQLRYETPHDICEAAADALAAGKIVAWVQGGVEFGERALGFRSILADPRSVLAAHKIAQTTKERPLWQPFAPSVLADRASEIFELPSGADTRFMQLAVVIKPHWRDRLAAVTAPDATARVQTVCVEQNPRFARLIEAFERRTGVPVLLNTSFNLDGEPIVATVRDAIRSFYASGLDVLVIGKHMIRKDLV